MINQIIKKIEYPVIKMVLFVEFIYYFMYHEILPFLPLPLYVNSRLQRECNQCISLCIHYSNCVEADQDGVQL